MKLSWFELSGVPHFEPMLDNSSGPSRKFVPSGSFIRKKMNQPEICLPVDETATALPVKGNYFPIFHSHLHTRPMASDLFHCGFHYRPRVFRLLGPISEDRGVSSVLPNVDRNLPRRILPI